MLETVVSSEPRYVSVFRSCQWGSDGLVLGHIDGSLSVFKNGEKACSILNPGQQITFLRALENTLFVSFQSGILAQYHLSTGMLKQYVLLDSPLQGFFPQEDSLVAWGQSAQVTFLNRLSLDIEQVLTFDTKPIKVCRDSDLALLLSSGYIQFIDPATRCLERKVKLPLDLKGAADLVDWACIDKNRWVVIQRDQWSILQQTDDDELTLELSAMAPSPLRLLVTSSRVSTFMILCENSQILLIEDNNIQILEPQWSPSSLKGLVYLNGKPTVILDNCTIYVASYDPQGWVWDPPLKLLEPANNSDQWLLGSKNYAAFEHKFGRLNERCEFEVLYTDDHEITCLHVEENRVYLGLETGYVDIIEEGTEWKLVARVYILCTPIIGIKVFKQYIACWSTEAVGLANIDQLETPFVIPTEAPVLNSELIGNLFYIQTISGVVIWDLHTKSSEPDLFCTVHFRKCKYIRISRPFRAVNLDASYIETDCEVGLRWIENEFDTISTFCSKPNPSTAALLYTIYCSDGSMSVESASTKLRDLNISCESFEELLLLLGHRSEDLRVAAAELFESLADGKRVETLMKTGGIRPVLLFAAMYPTIPVGDWLKAQLPQLFDGDTTDQIVALKVVSYHPNLVDGFPFKTMQKLQLDTVLKRFLIQVFTSDRDKTLKEICSQLSIPDTPYFLLCVRSLTIIITQGLVRIEEPEAIRIIGAVAQVFHKSSTGLSVLKSFFSSLLSLYPDRVLFNKPKQRIFVRAAHSQDTFGVTWDLASGHQLDLKKPKHLLVKRICFEDDGKAIVGEDHQKLIFWRFPGAFASLFGKKNFIEPSIE